MLVVKQSWKKQACIHIINKEILVLKYFQWKGLRYLIYFKVISINSQSYYLLSMYPVCSSFAVDLNHKLILNNKICLMYTVMVGSFSLLYYFVFMFILYASWFQNVTYSNKYTINREIFADRIFHQLNFCPVIFSLIWPLDEINLVGFLVQKIVSLVSFSLLEEIAGKVSRWKLSNLRYTHAYTCTDNIGIERICGLCSILNQCSFLCLDAYMGLHNIIYPGDDTLQRCCTSIRYVRAQPTMQSLYWVQYTETAPYNIAKVPNVVIPRRRKYSASLKLRCFSPPQTKK